MFEKINSVVQIKPAKANAIIEDCVVVAIDTKTYDILSKMFAELDHADTKYKDDRMSKKEIKASYQTIKCELQELKREISRKQKRWDMLHKEAIQVLAMGFKFNRDVCN